MRVFKLYVNVGTMLNADRLVSMKDVMPTRQQIITHIQAQQKDGQFALIELELPDSKMDEIIREIKIKSCGKNLIDRFFIVFIEDSNHPLMLVCKKKRTVIKELEFLVDGMPGETVKKLVKVTDNYLNVTCEMVNDVRFRSVGKSIEEAVMLIKKQYFISSLIPDEKLSEDDGSFSKIQDKPEFQGKTIIGSSEPVPAEVTSMSVKKKSVKTKTVKSTTVKTKKSKKDDI